MSDLSLQSTDTRDLLLEQDGANSTLKGVESSSPSIEETIAASSVRHIIIIIPFSFSLSNYLLNYDPAI